jgi:tetratricopeptide (TPR) repeat protein
VRGAEKLLFIAMAWVLVEPNCVTCLASCGYDDCDDWYHLGLAGAEQNNWYNEIFCFMNYCGDGAQQILVPYNYGIPTSSQPLNYYRAFTPDQPADYDANGSAYYWLNDANRLYLKGSFEQAVASYAKALKLDASLSDGWLGMGNALSLLHRYQEALDAYDSVLKLDQQNADAIQGKARALLALNRTDEANAAIWTAKTLEGRKIITVGSPRYAG